YSAPIVPLLIIAAIIGAERIGRRWLRWLPRGIPVVVALSFALTQSYSAGALPFTADFAAYTVTPHQQKLAGLAARIPPEARLSAQSDLYPHVSARANAYLFPTVGDADYLLLDVSGQTYPASPADYAQTVKQILNETPVSIVEADDGYLLLARGAALRPTPGAGVPRLPETFFSFLRADPSSIQQPLHVRFGDSLELLGYNLEIVPPRAVPAPAVRLRTYWRALRPPVENARFVFHVYAPTGYEAYAQADSPAELWYPTSRWSVGETVVVAQRALQVAHGGRVGVSVEWGDGQEVIPQGVDGNAEIAGTTLMLVTVR
ncbi:MAG: DUF2079 domain-containing protein, partial [Chloroflexi bacterium]|nr:DUF2079 domain-containing protein [Chloroflexota bacterium]